MQKAAIVFLPLAIMAFVAFAIFGKDRAPSGKELQKPPASGRAGAEAGGGDAASLRRELEELRKENAEILKRAQAAEARAAKLEAGAEATDPEESKPAPEKKADWKKRKDAELAAKVKAMPWKDNVKGVIAYWKEIEAARLEGRAVDYSPELVKPLQLLQKDMEELAKILGVENAELVFQNVMVGEAWMDTFLQEIGGGDLTEGQIKRLRETSLYTPDPESGPNRLENWMVQVERNRAMGIETQGILTPEQQAKIAATVTPAYLMSAYNAYSERTVSGAPAVTDYWLKSFKLDDTQRAAVESVAQDLVRRQAEIAAALSSQYGGVASRDYEFDLLLKTIEAQVAAEKKLAESLLLDAEQQKRFLRGSGAVLRLN